MHGIKTLVASGVWIVPLVKWLVDCDADHCFDPDSASCVPRTEMTCLFPSTVPPTEPTQCSAFGFRTDAGVMDAGHRNALVWLVVLPTYVLGEMGMRFARRLMPMDALAMLLGRGGAPALLPHLATLHRVVFVHAQTLVDDMQECLWAHAVEGVLLVVVFTLLMLLL